MPFSLSRLPIKTMRSAILCLIALFFPGFRAGADSEADPLRILQIFSNNRLLPANLEIDAGMREELAAELKDGTVELHTFYLDAIRFPKSSDKEDAALFLQARYAKKPPDVIVTIGPQAAEFRLEYQATLFPRATWLIGACMRPTLQNLGEPATFTARPMELSLTPLLEKLPEMIPDLRRLIVVTGASDFDRRWEEQARSESSSLPEKIEVQYEAGVPIESLLEAVQTAPPGSAILYLSYFETPDAQSRFPRDVAVLLAEKASAPIFGPYDTYLGTGIVGGAVHRFRDLGCDLAQLALRMESESPEGILDSLPPRFLFDHQQLERWRIAERLLPADHEILFRPPSLWEAHRNSVLIGSGILALQAALIGGLLVARSRQKKVERQLRQSERRFAGIFRSSPNAISLVRQSDGLILDVNPAWEKLTEFPHRDAVGHSPIDLGLLEDTDQEALMRFLDSGRRLREFEQSIQTRTGRQRFIRLTCEPMQLNGEPSYFIMAKDTTDQRVLEGAREELAHQSRLAMLGELSAAIAHEINQPLAAIQSNADAMEMLMQRETQGDLAELREILVDIKRDNQRAGSVIRKVRQLVQHREFERHPTQLAKLIGETLRLLAYESDRRGVSIAVKLPDALPLVRVDSVQIEQVLLNLVVNALEALEKSAVDDRDVIISARAVPGFCEVMVEDSGPGIASDQIDSIFDSFVTTKPDGMGLGLGLSRSVIQAHGGRIAAENRPEGGARFRFTLPSEEASDE